MNLYHFTHQNSTAIRRAVVGHFRGTKEEELAISRDSVLDLFRVDSGTRKLSLVSSTNVFGSIVSMVSFKLPSGKKDYLALSSDSGRMVILEYHVDKNGWTIVQNEPFGRTGKRRIVPGMHLAADPQGRAVMIGAPEKQKFAYLLNRTEDVKLTISSPLEAHASNTILYSVVGMDVGFENPLFVCLEKEYDDSDPDVEDNHALTFYELDLSLNHVVRKQKEQLEERGGFLISVPGGDHFPGGVLICSDNYLTYMNTGDQPIIRCPIPRRSNDLDDQERASCFRNSCTIRTKNDFFFLAQTLQGDIFKINLGVDGSGMVDEIRIKYFESCPLASSMCLLQNKFLFLACEFGNHQLYEIKSTAENDDEPEFSSSTPLEEGDTFFFMQRERENLDLLEETESLSPIMDVHVTTDLKRDDLSKSYLACGTGPRSSFKVQKNGLKVVQIASMEFPGDPTGVWTMRKKSEDEFDHYIVVTFTTSSLVLAIVDGTAEEVTDSGFHRDVPTLACAQMGEDSIVQIYPGAILKVPSDKRKKEWKCLAKQTITKCAINQNQIVIALSEGEIVYFEMDQSGELNEDKERLSLPHQVLCLAMASVPVGERLSRFLVVGLANNTVKIFSLDSSSLFREIHIQALPNPLESIAIIKMKGSSFAGNASENLHVGLQNGVLLKYVMDSRTGELTDPRTRFLGTKPVKLFQVKIRDEDAIVALSSRPWLSYLFQNRYHLTPLSWETFDYATGLFTKDSLDGIISICSNNLNILTVENLESKFDIQISVDLEYTPKKIVVHPSSGNVILAQCDHRAFTNDTKRQRREQMATELAEAAGNDEDMAAMAASFTNENLPENKFGSPKASGGMWASQIQILEKDSGTTLFKLPLEQNEAIHSMALVHFSNQGDAEFLLVGVSTDFQINPRVFSSGAIHTYRINEDGGHLELLHKTPVKEIASAICPFLGRVLLGVGKMLRIYDLGKKKLLRKCENERIPSLISDIQTMGNRVYVSTNRESVHFLRYKRDENLLSVFADDSIPRHVVCSVLIDYDTVACADMFGNIAILRLPQDVNDEEVEQPVESASLWSRGWLGGSAKKLETICQFFTGESVSSLHKVSLYPEASECLVYSTLSGTLGVLVPIRSVAERVFLQKLEMYIRSENVSLVGRDSTSFRSSFFPVKGVTDGDLCEHFRHLDYKKQMHIAGELGYVNPSEVTKKIDSLKYFYVI